MFSHGFLMVWVRRINNGFIGLNGFWVRLQGGALVSARLCRLPEQEVHQPSTWMPSALLVQLRQLHPLKNAVCFVGAAETAAPPKESCLFCWCSGDSCTPWCLFQIGHKSEFCVFCGSWLLRSENFSKKTLEPSAKPHANIVQVSAAKKFIIEKWKSCFEV